MARFPSQQKAKTILSDGTVQGNPLSPKQKGLFGLLAGGGKPSPKRMAGGGGKKSNLGGSQPPAAPKKTVPPRMAIGERPLMPKTAAKMKKMM